MSILIKGIEMPKDGTYICVIAEKTMWLFDSVTKIRQGEIYEVPTPHGRLIDADELLKYKTDHEMISTHLIWNAPTVIESEE